MRNRWVVNLGATLLAGMLGSTLLAPAASGQKREVLELQQIVNQLIQNFQFLQAQVIQDHAVQKTLLEQALDSVNRLSSTMGGLQKTVQDMQANSGARLDSMSTQNQGVSDNLQELMARSGRLNQQLTDAQNALQGIDAKLAGSAPPRQPFANLAPGPARATEATEAVELSLPPAAAPSADLLYSNALRDLTGRKYDLAMQEFQDYLNHYPETDLASNAQFYIGEIRFAQQEYQRAVDAYSMVLDNYPKSFKLAPAHLKKGLALVAIGQETSGVHELRTVIRLYPGTDEERRARAKLREMGITV